jgi:ATP-dependent Clp protease ATP-binding subunit ClpA
LRRLLRTELEDRLASALLFGNLKKGGKARLTCSNDGLELESGPAPKAAGKAPKNTRNALA